MATSYCSSHQSSKAFLVDGRRLRQQLPLIFLIVLQVVAELQCSRDLLVYRISASVYERFSLYIRSIENGL
jgi:hypothetical protein